MARGKTIIVGLIVVVLCVLLFTEFQGSIFRKRQQSIILERLTLAENNWLEAVERRHQYIDWRKGVKNFKPWGDYGTVIWNLFAPSFDCPHMRKRLGRIGDGGKWVCGLELLETFESYNSHSPCIVYSFGVNYHSTFEADILNRTKCQVFAYDMTVNGMGPAIFPANHSRVHFKKVGLGAKNTSTLRTLSSLMEENGHEWIDIFKIDIEGAEFTVFDSIMERFGVMPFGQMQMEIHLDAEDISKFYHWFERLESRGLRPFSAELNFAPCVGKVVGYPAFMEFSFININVSHILVPSEFVDGRQTSS